MAIIGVLLPATASVDVKDKYGATPLARAVQSGHVEAARALIDAGASVKTRLRNGEALLR